MATLSGFGSDVAAVFQRDVSSVFAHITPAGNLPSIKRRGLTDRRILSDREDFRPLGGVYVAGNAYGQWEDLVTAISDKFAVEEVAILVLTIPRGSRFALDEDEIDGMSTYADRPPNVMREVYGADFAPGAMPFLHRAVEESTNPRDAERLDYWSRRLAQLLTQRSGLARYRLRLFDPPTILEARIVRCR